MISGEITVTLDGIDATWLQTGDAMTFDSQRPHIYENRGRTTSQVVWVNTPPTF